MFTVFHNDGTSHRFTIAKTNSGGRYSTTRYRATLSQIREHCENLSGIAIPAHIEAQNFDPLLLIEQIRLDADLRLANQPIVVYGCEEKTRKDKNICELTEALHYENWAIAWSDAATITQNDLPPPVKDTDCLDDFIRKSALEPNYETGPHDMANWWGPYSVLVALAQLDANLAELRDHLKENICEDTFYLKKLRNHKIAEIPEHSLLSLKRCVDSLRRQQKSANRVIRILIVEDQLDIGWREAYESVCAVLGENFRITFSDSAESARKENPVDFDLILLDVRLDPDRDSPEMQDSLDNAAELSGVLISQEYRTKSPSVPIMAASASNKIWTLEALAGNGINAYWVKEAPQNSATTLHCIASTADLIMKIERCIRWDLTIRPRVDSVFKMAHTVAKHDETCGAVFRTKAKTLAAHEFQGIDSIRSDEDLNLHTNVSYLIVYSLINDLLSWILEKSGRNQWRFSVPSGQKHSILEFDPTAKQNKFKLSTKAIRKFAPERTSWKNMPEGDLFVIALVWLDMKADAAGIDKFTNIRNKLPLVHGRMATKGDVINASSKNIDALTSALLAFVKKACQPRAEA